VTFSTLGRVRNPGSASGVEQQTLDMALQRFTRWAAEAAQGTRKAKDAFAQTGIALRDQSGNLRRSAAGRGLWRHPALAPRLPSQIGGTVSRFHMVQGDVLRVVPTERYVYLNSLRLAPRLYGQAAARGTE
jgi:hypothetical protein